MKLTFTPLLRHYSILCYLIVVLGPMDSLSIALSLSLPLALASRALCVALDAPHRRHAVSDGTSTSENGGGREGPLNDSGSSSTSTAPAARFGTPRLGSGPLWGALDAPRIAPYRNPAGFSLVRYHFNDRARRRPLTLPEQLQVMAAGVDLAPAA